MNIGIQLYTVREPLKEDFKGTLEKLAKMGFKGVEFAYYYGGFEPEELARLLQNLGLQTIGIYESADNLCNPDAEVYFQADALGCKHLTFGFSKAQLEDFDNCLEVCGKAVEVAASKGKKLCYHAHAHEFARYDDGYQLDAILNNSKLTFEADTCWIQQGGEDVIGYMTKYADIIPLLHVKDVTAEGKITELGNGIIDFKAVVEFVKANKVPWVSYEQDITDLTPLESAQISINHLKSCF